MGEQTGGWCGGIGILRVCRKTVLSLAEKHQRGAARRKHRAEHRVGFPRASAQTFIAAALKAKNENLCIVVLISNTTI